MTCTCGLQGLPPPKTKFEPHSSRSWKINYKLCQSWTSSIQLEHLWSEIWCSQIVQQVQLCLNACKMEFTHCSTTSTSDMVFTYCSSTPTAWSPVKWCSHIVQQVQLCLNVCNKVFTCWSCSSTLLKHLGYGVNMLLNKLNFAECMHVKRSSDIVQLWLSVIPCTYMYSSTNSTLLEHMQFMFTHSISSALHVHMCYGVHILFNKFTSDHLWSYVHALLNKFYLCLLFCILFVIWTFTSMIVFDFYLFKFISISRCYCQWWKYPYYTLS